MNTNEKQQKTENKKKQKEKETKKNKDQTLKSYYFCIFLKFLSTSINYKDEKTRKTEREKNKKNKHQRQESEQKNILFSVINEYIFMSRVIKQNQ